MNPHFRSRFATLALVLAVGVPTCIPGTSEAKLTCDGRGIPDAPGELPGLPREAEAGRLYELTVDLPDAHAVNPRPVLMALRCASRPEGPTTDGFDGSGSALFRGTSAGDEGGSTFDVRFRRPGRWRVASMDVSGHFLDYGLYTVRPASIAPAGSDGSTLILLLVGVGGVAAFAGLAIAINRRRHRRLISAR
jgi:hypothetical protein